MRRMSEAAQQKKKKERRREGIFADSRGIKKFPRFNLIREFFAGFTLIPTSPRNGWR